MAAQPELSRVLADRASALGLPRELAITLLGLVKEVLVKEVVEKVAAEAVMKKFEEVVAKKVEEVMAVKPAAWSPAPTDSQADSLSVRQMVPHMPHGARSESSVRKWIKLGKIRATRVGGRWSIDREKAFVDQSRWERGPAGIQDFNAEWDRISRHNRTKKSLKRFKQGRLRRA